MTENTVGYMEAMKLSEWACANGLLQDGLAEVETR